MSLSGSMIRVIDLGGVFVFGLSGASLAARKGFDVVGVAVLAGVTALGGGILRDVVLGQTPQALRSPASLVLATLAAAVVMAAHGVVRRLERQALVFDAAGLGLYAVTGAARTLDAGLGWWAAVVLGATSAVGGGVLRDVLAGDVPIVFRADSGLYAIPAAAGALAAAACRQQGVLSPVVALAIAAAVFAFRLVAWQRHWTAPSARVDR